jgi:hypothetical protein
VKERYETRCLRRLNRNYRYLGRGLGLYGVRFQPRTCYYRIQSRCSQKAHARNSRYQELVAGSNVDHKPDYGTTIVVAGREEVRSVLLQESFVRMIVVDKRVVGLVKYLPFRIWILNVVLNDGV